MKHDSLTLLFVESSTLCVLWFQKIYTVTMDNVLESFYTESQETAGNHACHKLFAEISRLETILNRNYMR